MPKGEAEEEKSATAAQDREIRKEADCGLRHSRQCCFKDGHGVRERERDKQTKANMKEREKPVAKRHQMVSGSLALPYCFFFVSFFSYFNGSRAAAPVGDEVL